MVTQKDLNYYNLSNMEQYFEYIASCYLKGSFNKVDNLIMLLSKKQKLSALRFYYTIKINNSTTRRNAFAFCFISVVEYLERSSVIFEEESELQLKIFHT